MSKTRSHSRSGRRPAASAPGSAFMRLLFFLIGFYLIYRLVEEWIARRRPKPAPPAIELPPEVEAPVEAAPPIAEAPPMEGEAPPEELVFGVPVVEAPAVPDLHLTIPPDVALASFDPKYNFNWQNPTLLETIYPFRKNKLIDFLAIYAEIDLVKEYRNKPSGDPAIQAQIDAAEAELLAARQKVETALKEKIEVFKLVDPYFARIDRPGITNLTFRYTYYVGREIDRLEDKLDDLIEQKKTLLKRVDWYDDGEPQQQMWRDRAAELDPKIEKVNEALAPLRELQQLFQQQAELPKVGAGKVTVNDVMRWEMRGKRQAWEKMTVDQLVQAVVERIDAEPNRFPEWLVYMVIHFSGMRYISAHGSWAAPCFLVQVLQREDIEDEINNLQGEQLTARVNAAINEIQAKIRPGVVDPLQKALANMLKRLQNSVQQKRALLEYRTDQTLAGVQGQPDDDACLDRLVQYKAERDQTSDPIPDWVWAEIVKYTPLRLNTSDPDWEAFSPERWKFQNRHWAEVLNEWERKDITSWRQKHKESLELVVTRSVCNELGEHIQHLRGLTPAAGLTSKPKWYLRQVEKDPARAYFVQAPDVTDFREGASIFWLEWMAQQPSPWQVAHPITGFTFIPGQGQVKKGQKGEVRKRDLVDKDWDETGGWNYKQVGEAFQRERKLPGRQELKAMGKTNNEIQKILAEQQKTGGFEREYLRWRHEATVVDVVDLIDGRYVLTFETGKIGVILRSLGSLEGNPMVFAGYLPEVPSLPPEMDKKLVEMLRWDRILPGKMVKSRVRPLKKAGGEAPPGSAPAAQPQPEREVIVIREQVKCQQMQGRDNQGRPKFIGAIPPVKLARGMRVSILAAHKESLNDRGDGVIHSLSGEYYKISKCADEPKAVGKFIQIKETANLATGRWVKVHPSIPKTNVQVLKGYDLAGKPFFEPTPQINRVQIPGGARLRISTTHRECDRDTGDGMLNSSGLKNFYYLILECPVNPAANGYFIESDEIVPE